MPILNPSLLQVEGFSYDGSSVSIGTGLVGVPNAIMELAYDDGLEGVEYTRALGKVRPVAMTFGVYTPGDITMKVHKAYSDALKGLFAPLGNIFDVVSSIQAQYKANISAQSVAGAIITLPTRTDTLEGFRVIKIASSNTTGGSALMEDWTCKCLQVRWSGNAHTVK